jgi:hypothetical protein
MIDDVNISVYALYNRNKWILGYLSSIIVIQFALSLVVCTFPGGGRMFRVKFCKDITSNPILSIAHAADWSLCLTRC